MFAGLECHILSVGPDNAETRKKLEGAEALLRGGGFQVTADIRPGQADKVIAAKVESDGIDLLAMGAYGHSRMRTLIIGSTTSEMIRSCLIPIILFR